MWIETRLKSVVRFLASISNNALFNVKNPETRIIFQNRSLNLIPTIRLVVRYHMKERCNKDDYLIDHKKR